RAQSVTVIERVLTVKGGGELSVDKTAQSYAEVAWRGSNVETMWGIAANPLPQSLDLSEDVDTQVDQILVVDLTRDDGAYRSWFNNVQPLSQKTVLNNHYLVALHFRFTNPVAVANTYFSFRFKAAATWQYEEVKPTAGGPVNDIQLFWLDQPKSVDGWYLMAISKEIANQELAEYGKVPIVMTRVNRMKGQTATFNFVPVIRNTVE
ncbi:hypothetical protein WBG83_22475, partial [Paenibacillus sp. y28]